MGGHSSGATAATEHATGHSRGAAECGGGGGGGGGGGRGGESRERERAADVKTKTLEEYRRSLEGNRKSMEEDNRRSIKHHHPPGELHL